MLLHRAYDAILYWAFRTTLKGMARHQYSSLKLGSTDFFKELSRLFTSHFINNQWHWRVLDYLISIKQREGESLHIYLNCFNVATLEMCNLDQFIAMTALKRDYRKILSSFFWRRLIHKILKKCWLGQKSMPILKRHMMPIRFPLMLRWSKSWKVWNKPL